MIFDILFGQMSMTDLIISLLLTLPMMLLALSAHEAAHGYAAYKCGDMTAYQMGRLTLNPLHHLDPMGFLCMMVFGYGWARPVPVNARNFRNPRNGMAITAAAGPLANLLLGAFFSLLYGACSMLYSYCSLQAMLQGGGSFLPTCLYWANIMFLYGALINLVFMIFNLIPLPPFDGSRIFYVFLPQRFYFGIMRYERQIMMTTLIVLLLLSRFLNVSPFSYLAQKLVNLIAAPVARLMGSLLF